MPDSFEKAVGFSFLNSCLNQIQNFIFVAIYYKNGIKTQQTHLFF